MALFFVCLFFKEKNSLLCFVNLKLIIFSQKRQFCFEGVLTLTCIFIKVFIEQLHGE